MKSALIKISVLALSLFFFSCTHSVHLVNFSEDVPYAKKNVARAVTSETSQFVILGFTNETDYVNQAYAKLMSACPGGNIGAIATKYYTSHGFFSWTNHIVMNGQCYN